MSVKPRPPGGQDGGEVEPRTLRQLCVSFLGACLLLGMAALLASACQPREREPEPIRRSQQTAKPVEAPMATVAPPERVGEAPPKARPLPELRGEPVVRVLLARAPLVSVRLLRPARITGTLVPAGTKAIRPSGEGFAVTGLPGILPGPELVLALEPGVGAGFDLPGDDRSYSGDLVLRLDGDAIAVIEAVAMERYLHGVIEKEVEPDWPLEALKAQAVAARSYATAKWMERHARPWQLDASEQVDMAYAGHVAQPHVRLATAVDQTRGNLLWFADQPLPAFFHAASGGHGESLLQVWPGRTSPDGVTSPAPAMPAAVDPWAARGERVAPNRLGTWRLRITYVELAAKLRDKGLDFGRIERVRIAEGGPGGRVRGVDITGSRDSSRISAHALRMACGSTRVKSTLWTDFRFSDTALVIEGRGYGHGVGLPQASAWAMAQAGERAPAILAQYYPGALLVRKW